MLARAGTIGQQRGLAETIAGGLAVEGEWYAPVGARTSGMVDGQGRVGYFIVHGEDRADVLARARRCYEGLALDDERGAPLLLWPEPADLNG